MVRAGGPAPRVYPAQPVDPQLLWVRMKKWCDCCVEQRDPVPGLPMLRQGTALRFSYPHLACPYFLCVCIHVPSIICTFASHPVCSGDVGIMRCLPSLILGLCVRGTFSQLCPTPGLEPLRPAWLLLKAEGGRREEGPTLHILPEPFPTLCQRRGRCLCSRLRN